VSTRISEEVHQKLEDRADSKAEFIRQAIREKLDQPTVNTRINQNEEEIGELSERLRDLEEEVIALNAKMSTYESY